MSGRKKGQGSKWIRKDKRLAIYLRDGMACVYCGETAEESKHPMTLDHVLACELGGTNKESNLVTCCLSCNSSKRHLTLADWFTVLEARGVETADLAAKIQDHTGRSLKGFRKTAKEILANR